MGCTPCQKRREAQAPRRYIPTNAMTAGGSSDGMTYSLILPGQEKRRFGSRLEADAENARAGYTGVVRQEVTP